MLMYLGKGDVKLAVTYGISCVEQEAMLGENERTAVKMVSFQL